MLSLNINTLKLSTMNNISHFHFKLKNKARIYLYDNPSYFYSLISESTINMPNFLWGYWQKYRLFKKKSGVSRKWLAKIHKCALVNNNKVRKDVFRNVYCTFLACFSNLFTTNTSRYFIFLLQMIIIIRLIKNLFLKCTL